MSWAWASLVWLMALGVLLLAVNRWITRHLQGIGLLLFGDSAVATVLYFVVMLPGVALHEVSHWAMASLLRVRTGGVSLWPKRMRNGRVRLGSVQVQVVDPFRESLIGLAPFLVGTAAVLLIARQAFGVQVPVQASPVEQLGLVLDNLSRLSQVSDAWLWLYLLFAISNSMLPSETDRRPWRMMALYLILVSAAYYALVGVPRVPDNMVAAASRGVDLLSFAFGLTLTVDLLVMVLVFGLEIILEVLRQRKIEY